MSNLEKAKEIVKAHYTNAQCGIHNSRNTTGDTIETIYECDDLIIAISGNILKCLD